MEQALRQIGFLSQVAEADLRLLAHHAVLRRYRKGQIIFHQGDAPSALYLLRRGRARVFLPSAKGTEVTLAILELGDHFGELGVLDGQPRSASVQAMEDTEALTLNREAMLRFLREHSDAALSVCVSLAQRLRQADERLAETLFFPLASRLARTLLALAAQTGSSEVRLTQEALAAMVGASRQRVNEALGVWAERGWIERHRGKVMLVRPQALKALDKEPIQ